jgi:hypothetical protein
LGTSLPGREQVDSLPGHFGQQENNVGHSEFDPASRERRPWNAGRMIGAKRALKPQQVWAIRFCSTESGVSGTERFLTLPLIASCVAATSLKSGSVKLSAAAE